MKKIGRGGFARVYQAKNKENGKMVAVKCFNKDRMKDTQDIKYVQNEIDIMSIYGDHKNLVQ